MENINDKVLPICCVCNAIRISDENDLWLKKDDNPLLYSRIYEKFKSKFTHSYCPEDFEKAMGDARNNS